MTTVPAKSDDTPLDDARYQSERPPMVGDMGQDSAFATESHPEGLRYGERPHVPGTEFHGVTPPEAAPDAPAEPLISIG